MDTVATSQGTAPGEHLAASVGDAAATGIVPEHDDATATLPLE